MTFKDRSGKILQSTSVAKNGPVTPPTPLVWPGYDFSEWSDAGAFEHVTSDLLSTAIYVRAATTYQVTVGTLSTGGTEGAFKFDMPVTVVAGAAPDGKQFSHWEQDGKKVSTKPEFTFYAPLRNTTLTAVFSVAVRS